MALQAVYEEVRAKGAGFYTAGCNLSSAPAQPANGKVL